ncbi:unnamed protein product, partial [Brenthis ino]
MVPECTSEMATYGDEAGEQDGGEVFSGRLSGDGHVPWTDRVDSVAAAAQPALQCDGRSCQPQLYGLSIAPILRFMSALQLNITIEGASINGLKAWCKNFVELLISDTGTSKCTYVAVIALLEQEEAPISSMVTPSSQMEGMALLWLVHKNWSRDLVRLQSGSHHSRVKEKKYTSLVYKRQGQPYKVA